MATRSLLYAALTVVLVSSGALAQRHPKFAEDLDLSDTNRDQDVIVVYREDALDRPDRTTRISGGRGSRLGGLRLGVLNAAKHTLRSREIEELADDPDVESIHPDREVTASLDVATAAVGIATARNMGLSGRGVGIAILDSGASGPGTQVAYEQDFTRSASGALDYYGHGSHVAGVLGSTLGMGYDGGGGVRLQRDMRGMAPGARLVSLKVLNDAGVGRDSDVIAAIDRAIALKNTYNIRVMNLSLGRPATVSYKSDLLCQAVERAWKAGIVVVVAAGNHGRLDAAGNKGYGTITAPGNDPFVITVGAVKSAGAAGRAGDVIASYSSKGPTQVDRIVKPDLVAPGNQMISFTNVAVVSTPDSAIFWTYPVTNISGSVLWGSAGAAFRDTWFYRLNGTSMAAPMVSGAAALLIEKDPSLTPDQVKARLMKTATKSFPATTTATDPTTGKVYKSNHDLFTVGAGYLNLTAALNNTEKTTLNALSPSVALQNGVVKMVYPAGSTFGGTNVIWGENVIWGTKVVSGSNVIWGENVIWGTAGMQGYNVIWGTGGTAGSNVIWGETDLRATTGLSVLVYGEN